jgi:hypothetical protein
MDCLKLALIGCLSFLLPAVVIAPLFQSPEFLVVAGVVGACWGSWVFVEEFHRPNPPLSKATALLWFSTSWCTFALVVFVSFAQSWWAAGVWERGDGLAMFGRTALHLVPLYTLGSALIAIPFAVESTLIVLRSGAHHACWVIPCVALAVVGGGFALELWFGTIGSVGCKGPLQFLGGPAECEARATTAIALTIPGVLAIMLGRSVIRTVLGVDPTIRRSHGRVARE